VGRATGGRPAGETATAEEVRSRRTDWPTAIADSYRRLVGEPLCAPTELEDLPAVVLCHDDSVDPILVFANRAARDLWEAPLVGMPSRLTAPPEQRTERAVALAGTGVVRGYSGFGSVPRDGCSGSRMRRCGRCSTRQVSGWGRQRPSRGQSRCDGGPLQQSGSPCVVGEAYAASEGLPDLRRAPGSPGRDVTG
jgi:hypothetical protein